MSDHDASPWAALAELAVMGAKASPWASLADEAMDVQDEGADEGADEEVRAAGPSAPAQACDGGNVLVMPVGPRRGRKRPVDQIVARTVAQPEGRLLAVAMQGVGEGQQPATILATQPIAAIGTAVPVAEPLQVECMSSIALRQLLDPSGATGAASPLMPYLDSVRASVVAACSAYDGSVADKSSMQMAELLYSGRRLHLTSTSSLCEKVGIGRKGFQSREIRLASATLVCSWGERRALEVAIAKAADAN